MATTPRLDVNRAPRRIVSVLAGFAVALTFLRFSAARLQAERDARRPAAS